jgi:hypothetical protein
MHKHRPTAGLPGKGGPIRVRLLAWGALLALLVAVLTPMAAIAQAETTTTHFSDSMSEPDTNPCTGAPGTIDLRFQGVTHVTELADGGFHETTTITGTFTFVPDDASQPTLSGKFTIRTGENLTEQSYTATATSVFLAKGTDGSRADAHLVFHITVKPDGAVTVTFEKPKLHCR